MIPVLLILIPLLSGLFLFFLKEEKAVKNFALIAALISLAVVVYAITLSPAGKLAFDTAWLPVVGSRFSLGIDGMGKMLILLTAISFPVVFISTSGNSYKNTSAFYALMLLTQCGLMGVFLATDALLFYFFWELALVPVYFLCSIWGGEKRIAVTFKFFIYTFIGSLLMLAGFLFWLFFIAFAIKMPIFPLHTWQPDAYEEAPTAVTMVLSGVMVKMGIFAVIRWLIPMFPQAANEYATLVMILSITGMIYASLIAIKQDDIKRLIAYSSIAHIGLMCAAIFAHNQIGLEGVMIQMFNHGINVIGLWIVANAIEQQLQTRKFSELGGLAQTSPVLAILLVVMALANIALPLTNAFVGEFLMFNGLFQFNVWMAVVAGISIILAAVYTLNMIQKIFYGKTVAATEQAVDISSSVKWTLIFLVIVVLILGVYPQPLINLTKDTVNAIVANR